MRITTIYRGIHNVQRVRTDLVGVAELESDGPVLLTDPAASRAQTGFGSSTLTADSRRHGPLKRSESRRCVGKWGCNDVFGLPKKIDAAPLW